MRFVRVLAILALFCFTTSGLEANAKGFFSRLLGNVERASSPMQRSITPPRTTYPTRNLDQGRTRLPSGRSYYQGRYYGNFNNRFYGPQYGYF